MEQNNNFVLDVGNDFELAKSNYYENDISLYDEKLLQNLDFDTCGAKFNPPISTLSPGPGLKVRPLCSTDYDKGFLSLLGQLTAVGDISKDQFLKRFHSMKLHSGCYYVTIIEDTETNQVIGAGTLVVEQKFIRNCAIRGFLEDIVVSDQYRGRQLGKLIVMTLNLLAKSLGCYKISLSCKDKMVKFYESLGYYLEEGNANYMQIRFPVTKL